MSQSKIKECQCEVNLQTKENDVLDVLLPFDLRIKQTSTRIRNDGWLL